MTDRITKHRGDSQSSQSKSPAFYFYPQAFRGSRRVQGMSFAARGMLIELFCEQWEKGSVPATPEECAADFGGGAVAWKAAWKKLRAHFVPRKPDGRLINVKMKQLRDDREKYLKGQRERGLMGVPKRWPAHSEPIAPLHDGDGVAIAKPNHRSDLNGSDLDLKRSDLKEKDHSRSNKPSRLNKVSESFARAYQEVRK